MHGATIKIDKKLLTTISETLGVVVNILVLLVIIDNWFM